MYHLKWQTIIRQFRFWNRISLIYELQSINLIHSLTSFMQWYNCFESFLFCFVLFCFVLFCFVLFCFLMLIYFKYWFCHLDCHFLSIDASCDGCHAWGRQRLLNPEHLVVISAGPICHNSIHLLILTADFVALYWFNGYVGFIITSFLTGVESGDQCLLNSEVLPCFLGSYWV